MSLIHELKFNAHGHVPAIIQDATDHQVLTLCYMTREALEKTIETGKVHVFRRSQGRLMLKGETSGHIQTLCEIRPDCENKSLLIKVHQKVAACHMGYRTCYYRKHDPASDQCKAVEERVFDPDDVY